VLIFYVNDLGFLLKLRIYISEVIFLDLLRHITFGIRAPSSDKSRRICFLFAYSFSKEKRGKRTSD
jgi:hypothetical protein